jgi:hypothetical protein
MPQVSAKPVQSHPSQGELFLRRWGSWLAGLSFPLGGWWIRDRPDLRSEPRRERGCVWVLPGVEGKSTLPLHIVLGLVDAGLEHALEIHDWTTGVWPLFLYHLRNERRSRRRARRLADRIVEYQDRYPDRPTFLVGHSGGAALTVFTLECLPRKRRVTAAFLLGAAMSRHHDLSTALNRSEYGIWNFYSPLDLIFLTAGTFIFGTADSRHDVSAGAWGFSLPRGLPVCKKRRYETNLHQIRYSRDLVDYCHFGGHFGWANRLFVADRLAALIRNPWARSGIDR